MGQNDDGSGGSHDPLPEGDDEGSGVDVRQTPFEDHQPGSSVDGQAQAGEAPSGHQESAHFPPWTAIGEQPSLVAVVPDVEGGPATVLRGMVGPGIRPELTPGHGAVEQPENLSAVAAHADLRSS